MSKTAHLKNISAEQCRSELIEALRHSRHKNVVWSRADHTYKVNVDGTARGLPGVHSLLDVLCPTPQSSALAKFGRAARASAGRQQPPAEWNKYVNYASTAHERGTEGGTIVHGQMETYCKGGRAMLLRQHPKPHKYTLALVEWIEKNNLVPLIAEWPIYDELHLGFATRVDMVVWNPREKKYELWEIKTGYNQVFCVGTGRAAGPLRPYFDNSNLSRAMIQALLAKMALKFRYDIHTAARVVLVNDDGVRSKVLEARVINNLHPLYLACAKFLKDVRKRDRLASEKNTFNRAKLASAMRERERKGSPLHARPRATRSERVASKPTRPGLKSKRRPRK